MKNTLKIIYILIAGAAVFFVNDLLLLAVIIVSHAILLPFQKGANLKFLYKVRWFVALILVFTIFSGEPSIDLLKIRSWTLSLSYEGIENGLIMVLKLMSMLFITNVVRNSMSGNDFVQGMKNLGLSASSSEIINEIMNVVSNDKSTKKGNKGGGSGHGGGNGKGQQNKSEDETTSADVLLRGKLGRLPDKVLSKINDSKEHFADNPNMVIASSSLSVTLIRMVKIAPGLPLAPGHKNILLFPIFIYAIIKSDKKNAGSQIGLISGILHFSLGFGKYGPLSLIEFLLLGWIFDLAMRFSKKKTSLWFVMLLGGAGGLVRIFTEIALAYILGMPGTFYIIYLPYVISQVAFGAASGLITKAILKPQKNESIH